MPEAKRQIPGPNGKPVDVTPIGFQVGGEYWNEYLLDDGSVLRMKPVMVEVLRVDNAYDGEDNPVYISMTQNVVVVNSPERLRKKK